MNRATRKQRLTAFGHVYRDRVSNGARPTPVSWIAVARETFEDVVRHRVPEPQRRSVCRTEYAPGMLREQPFGAEPLLPASHPAAGFPDIEKVKRGDAEKPQAAARLPRTSSPTHRGGEDDAT
ncbi:MAG: hypothetical protein ACRYHA_14430 [Janthinobacterium lividum]